MNDRITEAEYSRVLHTVWHARNGAELPLYAYRSTTLAGWLTLHPSSRVERDDFTQELADLTGYAFAEGFRAQMIHIYAGEKAVQELVDDALPDRSEGAKLLVAEMVREIANRGHLTMEFASITGSPWGDERPPSEGEMKHISEVADYIVNGLIRMPSEGTAVVAGGAWGSAARLSGRAGVSDFDVVTGSIDLADAESIVDSWAKGLG